MKSINIQNLFKRKIIERSIILIASIIFVYLLVSLYFHYHFFYNTVINGVNVSLKAHKDVDDIIKNYIKNYELELIESNGETDRITGQEIGMQYNESNCIHKIYSLQNSFNWISALSKSQNYHVVNLYVYNYDNLISRIKQLKCIKRDIIESRNVDYRFSNGTYEVIEEVFGNRIIYDKLSNAIKLCILKGNKKLDIAQNLCYDYPKYTISSIKTKKTQYLLNKYVGSNITYQFGKENEILDANTIHEWLSVDDNLDVVISKDAVMKYVSSLSKKYDTVGVARNFKTSIGKMIEVNGGLYGWKINQEGEKKALLRNINHGDKIEREPVYTQTALSRDGNEIGDTYVEINITRQHLWFYKDGKLLVEGAVVTGNPNRGFSTVLGTYMLNYKQKGETLTGPGYSADVTYWMPFYGNIGIHDASWRYSFGGEIYKRNGSHGCVNAPLYLAKTIFENIEAGIPIICYEEKNN